MTLPPAGLLARYIAHRKDTGPVLFAVTLNACVRWLEKLHEQRAPCFRPRRQQVSILYF